MVLIFTLIYFSTCKLSAQVGWDTVFNTYISENIKFLNHNIVLATGEDGAMHRSSNGGINWTSQNVGNSGQRFQEISVIDSSLAFIAGDNNAVFKTTNGGLSWINISPQNFFGFYQTISFLNSNRGIIGHQGKIYATTNGGSNWASIRSLGSHIAYKSSVYLSPSYIIAAGDSNVISGPSFGIIDYSSDNGNTWSRRIIVSNDLSFKDLEFLNSQIGIGLTQRKLLKTTDGGLNWNVQYTFQNVDLNGCTLVNQNIMYVTGFNGIILRTIDGGMNWDLQNTGITSHLRSIDFFDANLGVASGDFKILKTTTGGITPIILFSTEIPNQFSLSQNYPNPFNPTTKIRFALPKSSFATLVVYDALGREVAILVNEQLNAGTYEAYWNADRFSSGVYYYKLIAGDFTETKKMVLVK